MRFFGRHSCCGSLSVRRYQDFKAWLLAAELNGKVFELTSAPPSCHDFRFRDNIRDAADSAQRNFPEGFGRFAPGDFARFLDHSRASLLEVKNELTVGLDRGYFRAEDVEDATSLVERALKALSGLQQYLRSPQAKLNAQRARAAHIARREQNPRTDRT
jgi:four helix bundle protein